MIHLRYDRGSIIIRGEVGTPYGRWDPRIDAFRAMAIHYPDIIEYLDRSRFLYVDKVADPLPTPPLNLDVKLRPYQKEALGAWLDAGRRGVIELPTGAGKTVVALKAMEDLGEATLVVVPTLILVDQWRRRLEEDFGVDVGVLGGGSRDVRAITVATYDSASIRAESIGNRFGLLVFDEVHHLPASSYRRIGLMYTAPHRLGLTATLAREDGAHVSLMELVGRVVYEMGVDELVGVHLSDYTVRTVHVPLSPEEQLEYDRSYSQYRGFIQRRGIRIRSAADYQRFVMRTGRDPEARRALDLLLGRETRERQTLGFEVARLIGVERARGFLTYYARFDLALVLDLCRRVGASRGDARVAGLVEFIRRAQGSYGLWEYIPRPQVSHWVTFDLLHSLSRIDESGDWVGLEPRTPFQAYARRARRF